MRVNHRISISRLLALLAVMTLTACGQQGAEPTSSTPTTAEPSSAAPSPSPSPTQNFETWEDNSEVAHLFFHSLVVDPERAFDNDAEAPGYLDYMVTVDEFNAILEQIYERDYILVSPHDLYDTDADGGVETKPLQIPEDKKPLVLSFDDLSYYEYMDGDGFADRLVLHDGKVVNEYTDADGTQHTGAYDHVPILDAFIEEHPDFSHEGAKGTIAMTGYNGVFGYRTSQIAYGDSNSNIEQDQETAKEIAEELKDSGWEFASHSWGHINYTSSSAAFIQEDDKKWRREVEPLIGETDLLIYPFGADIAGVEDYAGVKFEYLKEQGFNAFFNVDASVPAWGQLRPDYLRQARINVDGISLKNAVDGQSETLAEFFDPASVLDPARPESISGTT